MATHRLFARQIAKARRPSGEIDIDVLGALVAGAYEEGDADRRMTDRTIRLMSDELHARNNSLRDSEARLSAQNRLFDTTMAHMAHGLCMFDAELRLLVCNRRYLDMLGFSAEVVKPGVSLLDIYRHGVALGHYGGRAAEEMFAETKARVAAGGSVTVRREIAGGRIISISRHPMAGGSWVATYEDVTERLRADAKIAHMAHHDALTGLSNRAAFTDHLSFAAERAALGGDGFTLLCMDLDRFKEINDVFGHSAGDALLHHLAHGFLKACKEAFLARVGGDEFMVIAPCTQARCITALAERLFAVVAQDFDFDGNPLRVGLSIGSATFPTDGADASSLLANADAALYRAKAEGRGIIKFFEPSMDMRLREKRALQIDLQLALARGELSLHFQPQARVNGEVIGFEALLRWNHPVRGDVPSNIFIPIAEECGAVIPIGDWMMHEVCREAAGWEWPLQVSVNLSPVQLRHGDLVGLVHSALLESGLAPHRLELELDESVLIDDFSLTLSILCRLKALGVRVAMDDFGSGYSALSYLQSFPFDKIKIGAAFVANIERNAQSESILRAVIDLGRGLGLSVLAEGVERPSQVAFLADRACDEVQGKLVGRPRPIEDYADLIGRPLPPQCKAM